MQAACLGPPSNHTNKQTNDGVGKSNLNEKEKERADERVKVERQTFRTNFLLLEKSQGELFRK